MGGASTEDSPEASDGELTFSDFAPNAVGFDAANAERQYLQQERTAQDNIAACMAEQGFEYIPYVPNQDQYGFSDPESEREWVEQYGFGITTKILQNQWFDQEAVEAEMAKDPNYAIIEAMSPEEREAYYAALRGVPPDIDFETLTAEEIQAAFASLEPTGCENTVYAEIFDQGAATAFYEQFGPMLKEIDDRVASDPRIVELEGKWSSCMVESGYDFAERNGIEVFLFRRLDVVRAISHLDIDPDLPSLISYQNEEIEPGARSKRR